MTTSEILVRAKEAKTFLSTEKRNEGLLAMAEAIIEGKDLILAENKKDLFDAEGRISPTMLDRLMLNEQRIMSMADGIKALISLPDPLNRTLEEREITQGMRLKKVAVPMGVVAIIYESRPNVTSDAVALCLKSGNVCILRGGKDAYRTSKAISEAMRNGLNKVGISPDFVNMIDDTSHESANQLMKANGYVDLLIPRGGKKLISACIQNATVPCIETGTGICTIYVDADADLNKALKIVENAKTSRPSVCNAEETLLVNRKVADKFLPELKKTLVDKRINENKQPVELRLYKDAMNYIDGVEAKDEDFDTEFLDYILAIKLVDNVFEAVEHIKNHSTHHSEAIITENKSVAEIFVNNVDSAAVYVNASTRFTDGGMFGLGCEMGISTQKLHARGPMGLNELTSYKYIIEGDGQIR